MVITILHVTLSARPTKKRDGREKKEKKEEEKAEEAKEEEEEKEDQFWREMATVQDEGETREEDVDANRIAIYPRARHL